MSKKVFQNLTEEKMDRIKAELIGISDSEWAYIIGISDSEWAYIKGGVDYYFSTQAAKIKLDDSDELDSYLKRKY